MSALWRRDSRGIASRCVAYSWKVQQGFRWHAFHQYYGCYVTCPYQQWMTCAVSLMYCHTFTYPMIFSICLHILELQLNRKQSNQFIFESSDESCHVTLRQLMRWQAHSVRPLSLDHCSSHTSCSCNCQRLLSCWPCCGYAFFWTSGLCSLQIRSQYLVITLRQIQYVPTRYQSLIILSLCVS